MKKRFGALLLVLCLLAGLLAGCGSKEEDDGDKKDKVSSVVKGTVAEMVEAIAKVKQGRFRIQVREKDGESAQNVDIDLDFNEGSKEYSVSLSISSEYGTETKKTDLGEVLKVTGNNAYVNIGALKEVGLTKADGSAFEGWFRIPLPKDLKIAERKEGFAEALGKIAGKLIAGDALTGSEGDYTLILKGREAWSAYLRNLRTYMDDGMKEDLKDVTDKMGEQDLNFDLGKYFDDLMDEYESDIRALIDRYGAQIGVSSEDIDAALPKIKEAVREADIKEIIGDRYVSQMTMLNPSANPEALMMGLREKIDDLEENLGEAPDVTVRMTADDMSYCLDFQESYKTLYDEEASSRITIRLEPDSVNVSAPSDRASLKDLGDLFMPSLIRYRGKATKTADAEALADVIRAASLVAVDPMLDLPIGTKFEIGISGGKATFAVVRPDGGNTSEAVSAWNEIHSFKGFKGPIAMNAEGRIVGTLEYETYNGEGDNTSGLVWRCGSANADLNEMLETGPLKTGVDWADE